MYERKSDSVTKDVKDKEWLVWGIIFISVGARLSVCGWGTMRPEERGVKEGGCLRDGTAW